MTLLIRITGARGNKGLSDRTGNMMEKDESENGLWCRIKNSNLFSLLSDKSASAYEETSHLFNLMVFTESHRSHLATFSAILYNRANLSL